MKDTSIHEGRKVVPIDRQREIKHAQASLLNLLRDTPTVARAIQDKTCLKCHTKKLCVNKTGLCAACYGTLNQQEKKTADGEAAHKIITISVTDDRWRGGDAR